MSPAPTHTRGQDAHRRGIWLSPTCKCRAPPLGSQSPTIRRPVSAHIRHGSPFLTRVPMCTLTHGPARTSSPSIRIPISGQQHSSRGSKTYSYHVREASCTLPICPPNFISPFLSPFDTLACENPSRGEAAATEWPTTEHRCPKPSNPHVEDLEESGGALAWDNSPILHGSPGDLDSLGLVCTVMDADAGRVEPSRVDAHEQGGVLPVTGAAPVLAEETAGVEPAGEAERAAAAKSEALAPWMQGETRRESRDAAGRQVRSRDTAARRQVRARATARGAATEARVRSRQAKT